MFTKTILEDAVECVQWEYEKRKETDDDKFKAVEKLISDKDHPYAWFHVGK